MNDEENYESDIALKSCEVKGHAFGEWKHIEWTEFVETVINYQTIDHFPVKEERWERTCKICGHIEKTSDEPQELFDERAAIIKDEISKKLVKIKKINN